MMEFARLLRLKFIEAIRGQENALEIERLYDRCVGATAIEIASDRSKAGGSFMPTPARFADARGIGQNGYTVGVVTGACPRCGDTTNAKGMCCGR